MSFDIASLRRVRSADFGAAGAAVAADRLPAGVGGMHQAVLSGTFVLQVQGFRDVAQPVYVLSQC